MDLILWRHAEAEDASESITDHDRKLTQKGIKQASKMARWLDANLNQSCRIYVSPTRRTLETMDALDRKFKVSSELLPDADMDAILTIANWPNSREQVLIVGHQPYLGHVAAHLLTSHSPLINQSSIQTSSHALELNECSIRKANVWWITQKHHEINGLQTYLKALMTPDLVVK